MARDFDGTDDYIDWGNLGSLIHTPSALSGSIWVWLDDLTADHTIANTRTPAGGINWQFDDVGSVSGRTDMFNIFVEEDAGTNTRIESATASAVSGAWQHVFFSFVPNAVEGLQLWINGVEDANSPVNTTNIDDLGTTESTNLRNGSDNCALRDHDGRLAEQAYWSRVLTDAEIIILSKGY